MSRRIRFDTDTNMAASRSQFTRILLRLSLWRSASTEMSLRGIYFASFSDEGFGYEPGGSGLAAISRDASLSMTSSARRNSFSSGTGGALSDG